MFTHVSKQQLIWESITLPSRDILRSKSPSRFMSDNYYYQMQ